MEEKQKTIKEELEEEQNSEAEAAVKELEDYIAKEVGKLSQTLQEAADKDNSAKFLEELGNQLIFLYDQHLRLAIDFQHFAAQSQQFQATTNLILRDLMNQLPKPGLYNHEPSKIEIIK